MPGAFSKAFSTAFNVYTFNITTTFLPNVQYNDPYSSQLEADEASSVWTLESGVLPVGITLSAAGLLSGTSTDTGSFPITVKSESSLTSEVDYSTYTMTVLSSSAVGWERRRSIWNFRLFGGIYNGK